MLERIDPISTPMTIVGYERVFKPFPIASDANAKKTLSFLMLDHASAPGNALKQREHNDERVARLETIPGVGSVSALPLVAAVDKITRFAYAKQLTAYNGIVPTLRSSGEREQQGAITRQGRSEVRAVWIQAAHSLVRSRQAAAQPLQRWFWKVARRRGVRTGIVALARKMLSLAFYLLRDGTQYEPLRLKQAAT